jgi:hypothetical protein
VAFNFDRDMPIWFEEEPNIATSVNIYKEWFEIPFLQSTEQFYRMEANKYHNDSLIEYLRKASIS